MDAVENQLSFFTQDLLRKIDTVTLSQYSSLWTQNYDQVYNTVTELQTIVNNLQTLYVNLNYIVTRNYGMFTGHTGLAAGAAHNGL